MKKYILALTLVMVFGSSYAQSSFYEGRNELNVGVGMSQWGIPFYVGMDFGVNRDITIGGEFSYRAYQEKVNANNWDHSIMGFSGNFNYHFNTMMELPPRFDFYAGLNIGFYVWTSPSGYPGNHSNGLGLGGQVGGRFFFTNKLGINVEFGGGNAFAGGKLGVTVRI